VTGPEAWHSDGVIVAVRDAPAGALITRISSKARQALHSATHGRISREIDPKLFKGRPAPANAML
jgi:hypothetical protein